MRREVPEKLQFLKLRLEASHFSAVSRSMKSAGNRAALRLTATRDA
jgi:hypothetical protein